MRRLAILILTLAVSAVTAPAQATTQHSTKSASSRSTAKKAKKPKKKKPAVVAPKPSPSAAATTTPVPTATPSPSVDTPATPVIVSPPTSAVIPQALVAMNFMTAAVGQPYVLGGTGNPGYDCSGLVMMAFESAGITLPRTSGQQFAATMRIALTDIAPGDLLFYGPNGSQHVVMYLGDGKVVAAATPADGVKISNMNGAWYIANLAGAGRVIAPTPSS